MTPAPPMPAGFRVVLDAQTTVLQGGRVLIGGQPRRVLRLSSAGAAAFAELQAGPVQTAAARALARRLCTVGAAHPRPPQEAYAGRAVVVIPVRDRAAELDRCLAALGYAHEVLVVDDGSRDADAVAKVAARHGATLVERTVSGGPAAARNSGLASLHLFDATTPCVEVVAFLDSDVVPPQGWPDSLLAHFADPVVGAVAPRVVPLATSQPGTVASYAAARSPLDLGAAEALVRPGTPVSYVPTAALVVRTQALAGLKFDNSLPYGEDVDLVWRLVDAGWNVRYDPSVRVQHDEPDGWPALLRRRFRYGTSAGPLARRHPTRLAPLVIRPWPMATVALLAARRPVAATAVGTVAAGRLARLLRRSGVPPSLAIAYDWQRSPRNGGRRRTHGDAAHPAGGTGRRRDVSPTRQALGDARCLGRHTRVA